VDWRISFEIRRSELGVVVKKNKGMEEKRILLVLIVPDVSVELWLNSENKSMRVDAFTIFGGTTSE